MVLSQKIQYTMYTEPVLIVAIFVVYQWTSNDNKLTGSALKFERVWVLLYSCVSLTVTCVTRVLYILCYSCLSFFFLWIVLNVSWSNCLEVLCKQIHIIHEFLLHSDCTLQCFFFFSNWFLIYGSSLMNKYWKRQSDTTTCCFRCFGSKWLVESQLVTIVLTGLSICQVEFATHNYDRMFRRWSSTRMQWSLYGQRKGPTPTRNWTCFETRNKQKWTYKTQF